MVSASDAFDRELKAAAAEQEESRGQARSSADAAEAAARQYQEWVNQLAPRFAAEARKRRKRQYQLKGGGRPFFFRRVWQVIVTSHETDEGYPLRSVSFWVFSNGTWRLDHVRKSYPRIRGTQVDAGLTYEEFAASFAREAALP